MWWKSIAYEPYEVAAWNNIPTTYALSWAPSQGSRLDFWDAAVITVMAILGEQFPVGVNGTFRLPGGEVAVLWARSYPANDGRLFTVVGSRSTQFFDALSRAQLRIQWASWDINAKFSLLIGRQSPISVDPSIHDGRPSLYGRTTEEIFSRHQAGESISAISRELQLEPEWVEEAVSLEQRVRDYALAWR